MDVYPDHRRTDSPRRARFARWAGRWALLLVAVASTILLHPGCSAEKHYQTLSLFFDGVPVPEGVEPRVIHSPQAADPWGPVAQATDEQDGQGQPKTETVAYFFHEPYGKRKCFDCHDRSGTYQAPSDSTTSCRKCHETYFEIKKGDWVHGPVAQGGCRRCHEPHKSVHTALLTQEQKPLCFDCHNPDEVYAEPMHAANQDQACSNCHDPHNAGNHALLADSRTYSRRSRAAREVVSAHGAWSKNDCGRCHISEQSNVLKEGIDAVCLECHKPVADQLASGEPMHAALAEKNSCVACHTPHRSSRPKLIRPTAEKICFECHKLEEIQKPSHPRVERADCLLCHHGHRSDRPALLKAPVHRPADKPSTAQADDAPPPQQGDPS